MKRICEICSSEYFVSLELHNIVCQFFTSKKFDDKDVWIKIVKEFADASGPEIDRLTDEAYVIDAFNKKRRFTGQDQRLDEIAIEIRTITDLAENIIQLFAEKIN